MNKKKVYKNLQIFEFFEVNIINFIISSRMPLTTNQIVS